VRRGAYIELSGQQIDQLHVVEYVGQQSKPRATLFRCRCSCGNECIRTSVYLRHAARQSCRPCSVRRLRDNALRNLDKMAEESGRCKLCSRSMPYPDTTRLWAKRGGVCRRCTRKLQKLESEE
jgi:hypothetical protein